MEEEGRKPMGFAERLKALASQKDTVLCVGLDPALPGQRPKTVIPARYLQGRDENAARLAFCLDIIEQTRGSCCAFKPNQQYAAGFTSHEHRALTKAIRDAGAASILDCKLSDISDTLESALYHFHNWGYDAFTFNPYMGNIEVAVKLAHAQAPAMGVFVLVLTSNPEAIRYQKRAQLGGRPLYEAVAEDVRRHRADGCVVGATAHVTEDEIRRIRAI
ncbi:MAG: orotidine 5'-phosphate decarboxylase / HUMPS family protein, partial [Candidatus Bathyarchaeia archaeon]